jgi:hypothetical protein
MRRHKTGVLCTAAGIEEYLEGQRVHRLMVTATYRNGVDYNPRQITEALRALKRWAEREGLWVYYVWRMEFGSQTGRLHYHVLVWLPERDRNGRKVRMPAWDDEGWWVHGMTRVEVARSAVGYLAKYASKPAVWVGERRFQTKGARWWGARAPPSVRALVRFRLAPQWVQDKAASIDGAIKRLTFGRWQIGAWIFYSPWELVSFGFEGVKVKWRGWRDIDFAVAA